MSADRTRQGDDGTPEREREPAPISRRALIAGAALGAGGALLARLPGTEAAAQGASPPVADPSRVPGGVTTAVSARSPFEHPSRAPTGFVTGPAYSPIHELTGTITPSDLHFERHHGGLAIVDPARYRLLVHGMVARPTVFTLEELKRLPSVSRVCFLECSGNGRNGYRKPKRELSPQEIDGLTSNGEWTGVLLSTLLREVGVSRGAAWLRAEGGDSPKLSRSIPIEKALDDAIVAWAFNGEPMRPANGYPVRLVLPGWEANTCIKWLRRVELADGPGMFRDETAKYTDPLPDGTARQFSFEMDAKSIITRPSYPARIARGWVQVEGLAWSGRGRVARVDVSTDGGRSWTVAELQEPVLPKAHTRFRLPWRWEGNAATLMSRATDETGYVQPTLAVFREKRGAGTDFHFNHIRSWTVEPDGRVFYGVDG
jgi:sulfane dehydrogenase subunit SoxC